MHVEFHAMLHDLKDSGQLSQKNKLMTEIQMKTIGKKIEDTMNEVNKPRKKIHIKHTIYKLKEIVKVFLNFLFR